MNLFLGHYTLVLFILNPDGQLKNLLKDGSFARGCQKPQKAKITKDSDGDSIKISIFPISASFRALAGLKSFRESDFKALPPYNR